MLKPGFHMVVIVVKIESWSFSSAEMHSTRRTQPDSEVSRLDSWLDLWVNWLVTRPVGDSLHHWLPARYYVWSRYHILWSCYLLLTTNALIWRMLSTCQCCISKLYIPSDIISHKRIPNDQLSKINQNFNWW
jgi:hypothetical protein